MTGPLVLPSGLTSAALPDDPRVSHRNQPDPARDAAIRSAAQRFESLLLQQLTTVMRESTPGMFQGTGGEMYGSMFDESFGEAMSKAGGFGLADMIAQSMGASPRVHPHASLNVPQTNENLPSIDLGPVLEQRPATGAALGGATGALQSAAAAMLPESGVAPQWGRDGTLTGNDLASDFSTEAAGGVAAFRVNDALGYQGYYKCNLFAFELARRAGFEVPLAAAKHGWSYLGPNAVTTDASDGELRGSWARVASSASAEQIDSAIVRGQSAFMLTASGDGEHRGHMGVVERVHEIERDESGNITRIRFDGWEGRSRGAMRIEDRVWSVSGTRPGAGGRGGLGRIELLELQRPEEGERPEQPIHSSPGASVRDGH